MRIKYLARGVLFFCLVFLSSMSYGEKPENGVQKPETVKFAFAGHIRGPRNFTVNSFLPQFTEEMKYSNNDFIVIAGDTICGYTTAYDEVALNREWDMVDVYLKATDIPIYRVPGNHDLHSDITKKVYNERYGSEYFSIVKGNVMMIGLNVVKLCPDESLDWGEIWTSNSPLPNIAIAPEGKQLEFLIQNLEKAKNDASIDHVVIAIGGHVLGDEVLRVSWQEKIHPHLVMAEKVDLVLSGESGELQEEVKDGILYVNSSWGIADDKDFSLQGTYLEVIFENNDSPPRIYTNIINMTPGHFLDLIKSVPVDTERQMENKIKLSQGEDISSLNKMRLQLRDWLNKHLRIYDRSNNISLMILMGVIFLFLTAVFYFTRKR